MSNPTSLNIIKQLKEANQNSENKVTFAKNACGIICGSILSTVVLAIMLAIPITMIAIGATYMNKCQINNKIPIWLVVYGSVSAFKILLIILSNLVSICRKKKEGEGSTLISCLTTIIVPFLFAWFICGNVWVFSARNAVVFDDVNSLNYCHQTCYLFSFWIIIACYILVGSLCLCCCLTCFLACCGLISVV